MEVARRREGFATSGPTVRLPVGEIAHGEHLGAQPRASILVDDTGGAEHDAIILLCRVGRYQSVGDVVVHPRWIACHRIAVAASPWADTDEFLAGADLHVRNLRG